MSLVALCPIEPTELELIADFVNDQFDRMRRYDEAASRAEGRMRMIVSHHLTHADNARVKIGRALLDVRERLRAGGEMSFQSWIEINVRRSRRDCYACIRIAETRDRLGCLSVVSGMEGRIWDRRDDEERKALGDSGIIPHHQSKRVQIMVGIYRKCSRDERAEARQEMERIDEKAEAETGLDARDGQDRSALPSPRR